MSEGIWEAHVCARGTVCGEACAFKRVRWACSVRGGQAHTVTVSGAPKRLRCSPRTFSALARAVSSSFLTPSSFSTNLQTCAHTIITVRTTAMAAF